MYKILSKPYILITLSITTLFFIVFLLYMMETGESKELYTNGPGYVLYKDAVSSTQNRENHAARTMPIGTITMDNKVQPVAMLSRTDKKINFSKIRCLKDIQRTFVQINKLGTYPLDANLEMLNKNPNLLEDFGKQWGRPVPDTVLNLFRKFIPDFKIWVAASPSKKNLPQKTTISGKFKISFGTLSQSTYLYFLPFKHGGSLGPIKYMGKREPALFVNNGQHSWVLPYICGNGPAEVILPCYSTPENTNPLENSAMVNKNRALAVHNPNPTYLKHLPKTYPEKNTEFVDKNYSTTTQEPITWSLDGNGGDSSGYSSKFPSADDDYSTNVLPDLPPFPIGIDVKPAGTDDNIPPIPEPATWLTMLLGLLFLKLRKK